MAEETTLETPAVAAADAPAPGAGATPATSTEQSAAPAGAAPDAGAGSDKKDDPPKSALDAVKRVMDASRAAAADAATPAKDEKKEQPGTAAAAGDASDLTRERITDGEWRALPEKERQRITQFRARLKEFGGYITEMTPKARTFDDLNSWMASSGVTQDDFVGGLQIIALLRSDPVKAWEALQPVIADLRSRIGEDLPADLAADVESGTINEARARELARTRSEKARLDAAVRTRDSAEMVRQEQANNAAAVESVRKGIETWEQAWKASDPDYPKKFERVWESMAVVIGQETQQGRQITPQRAVEIAKAARAKVEAWMSGLVPAAREKTPVVTNGSGAATVKQPSSALEAARLAMGR